MNKLEFYLKTSVYTNYLPYEEYYKSLPDDIAKLSHLLSHQVLHRSKLIRAYLDTPNKAKLETKEEMKQIREQFPWYKNRCDDDILITAPAITAELFRQDPRGFILSREIKNKVVITCRYVAVLLASILKAKKIPARCRSGYANYFLQEKKDKYYDHWIVQYYNYSEQRWINVDASGLYNVSFNQYDIPSYEFKWAADIWLNVRHKKENYQKYIHGSCYNELHNLAHALFFDFHAIMNDEISYLFLPTFLDTKEEFSHLTQDELAKIDHLAELMQNPDDNFEELCYLFRNDPWLRCINTPLLSDKDHLEIK